MKEFIDFEKDSEQLYINYYLDEYNITVKDPVNDSNEVVIEKFDLSKRIYLIHY